MMDRDEQRLVTEKDLRRAVDHLRDAYMDF
jgi:hypothetical protein